MKLRNRIILIVALLGLAAFLASSALKSARREQTSRLTAQNEQRRIADNAVKAAQGDTPAFFKSMGGDLKLTINPNSDGSYTVSVPSFKVSKDQLEKFSNEHTTWIEEQ